MIYENVLFLCKKKKMSISELENKAGLGNGTIGKWRESSPSIKTLEPVAEALGVSINRLLRKKGA